MRHVTAPSSTLSAFRPSDRVVSVECMDSHQTAEWRQDAGGLHIALDAGEKHYPVYVLKVTLDMQ